MAIQVFGAGAVQSAYVSYLALDITPNSLTLVWPDAYVDVPYTDPITGISYQVLAASMDVTTGAGNTHTITLPNATQAAVGSNFIITNVGLSAFALNKSDGSLLQNVTVGEPNPNSYYIQLIDNSTTVGVWRVITFGAGTSQASAVALAGNGLVALVDKLNTNIPVILTNTVPVIDVSSRANLIVWTGGSATLPLPLITSVPAGYYVSFTNQGTNFITIQAGETVPRIPTISGLPSIAVQQQQSLTIISDGTNWQTLGFGQNQFAVNTFLTLDVSASTNVTLTSFQAASIIQQYTGALTANITVFFPIEVNNWFIYNHTTGAHTLSVQLANNTGPIGTAFVVPQGSTQIFYSDSSSMYVSPTAVSLIDGSNTLPAISFISSPNTGISYSSGSKVIEFTIAGTSTSNFFQGDSSIGLNGFVIASQSGTNFEITTSDENVVMNYGATDVLRFDLGGNVFLLSGYLKINGSGKQILAQDGTATSPGYSFASNSGTGIWIGSSFLVFSIAGVNTGAISKGITSGMVQAFSAEGRTLELISDDTEASITYNGGTVINIDLSGTATFPTNPATTLNSLMPSGAPQGSIIYFNGTNWVYLAPPTSNLTLKYNTTTNAPQWE